MDLEGQPDGGVQPDESAGEVAGACRASRFEGGHGTTPLDARSRRGYGSSLLVVASRHNREPRVAPGGPNAPMSPIPIA
jgi:hypothetical protein